MDTNIHLRGLLNARSACGAVVDICDRRAVVLLLSKPVLSEYRDVLKDPGIVERYPDLTAENVDLALRRLRYVGETLRTRQTFFDFPRDPRDSKFIELAIAGRASHIVSGDKDMLSLNSGYGDAAKRFRQRAPSTRVVDAGNFLNDLEYVVG